MIYRHDAAGELVARCQISYPPMPDWDGRLSQVEIADDGGIFVLLDGATGQLHGREHAILAVTGLD